MPEKILLIETKKTYKIRVTKLIALCVLFIFVLSVSFSVLAETPSPESATETSTAAPTATGEPDYLYDFTVPPYNNGVDPLVTLSPDETKEPQMSDATIDVVKIENIEKKRGFRWSDLIKYLAYGFFGLAGVAIVYGLFSMAVLIFFKKDITLAGIKSRKKEKQKKGKNSKNKK